MRIAAFTLSATFLAALLSPSAPAQENQARHPAFTLVSRTTVTRPDGRRDVSEKTRYVSSNGSVREIEKKPDGSVAHDFLHESGRGSFGLVHDGKQLVKRHGVPPEASREPLPTAEQLRAHPNFAGTESILGHTTYIIRESHAGREARTRDNYYAPEFGKTPLKTVRYSDGEVFVVSEPVSVTPGEPDAAWFKAPADYEVGPMAPISGGVLNGKAVSKPAPPYPAEARAAGASGLVTVQVLVSEDGSVESAQVVSGHPLLHEAALGAARAARFSPTQLSGQPIKVSGVVTYNFVLR